MANANVKEFSAANWDQEITKSDVPVLVDFWAPWCGPCRALAPTIDRLADQYAGRVKVGKLNTDDNQELAVKYGISGIPQVLIFKGDGEPRERLVGLQPERELVKAIDRVLGL
jgi:thioredoxin 1